MPISSNIPAPEFELPDDTNTIRKLSDFRGKNIVLYFYPADDTAGCTKEACNFRDDYSAPISHEGIEEAAPAIPTTSTAES